jgi:hypothetical protein
MDHSYIEGAGLVDRYVRGRMPADERVAFEEHFLDCPQCLEQLEMARSFMEGLKITTAEAVDRGKAPKASVGVWFSGWGPWRIAGLAAAACLVVLVVPLAWLGFQLEGTRNELARIKLASTEEASPALFVLNEVRGPDTAESGPANRITLPKDSRRIVLAIERDLSRYRAYRVAIRNHDGKTVWQQDGLEPGSPDAIGISFPSSILSPGDYTVSLTAAGPEGKPTVPLAEYTFRALQ